MRILCILLLTALKTAYSKAPEMREPPEYIVDLTKEQELNLQCTGDMPMTWIYSSQYIEDPDVDISNTFQLRKNEYTSTFVMTNVSDWMTGEFTCYYEGTSSDDLSTSASSYVYLKGGVPNFIHEHSVHVMKTINSDAIFPCTVTYPNTRVQLTSTSNEKVVNNPRISFHPYKGFIIKNVTRKDEGLYTCALEESHSFLHVTLHIESASPSNPPRIHVTSNIHFVEGHSFSLFCSFSIRNQNSYAVIEWLAPRKLKIDRDFEVISLEKRHDLEIRSQIKVFNASKNSEGEYRCYADNLYDSYNVTIEDRNKSAFVKIENDYNVSTLLEEGTDFQWVLSVMSFPSNPTIDLKDPNGNSILKSSRLEISEIDPHSGNLQVTLHQLTAQDFGIYKLEANTSDNNSTDSTTVFVRIKSAPKIKRLIVEDRIFHASQKIRSICEVEGYPDVNISWSFHACNSSYYGCEHTHDVGQIIKEVRLLNDTYRNNITSKAVMTASLPGVVQCIAYNKLGKETLSRSILVTDIQKDFIFWYKDDDGRFLDINEDKVLAIVEKMQFQVTCGGIKSKYKNVTLILPNDQLNMTSTTTELSTRHTVKTAAITSLYSGNYTCLGEPVEGGRVRHKKVVIKVFDSSKPAFVNNIPITEEGNSISISQGTTFNITCKANGLPTPKLTWFKDDEPLDLSDQSLELVSLSDAVYDLNDVVVGEALVFKVTTVEDSGKYTCQADNREGVTQGYFTLTVTSIGTGLKIFIAVMAVFVVCMSLVVYILIRRVKKEQKQRLELKKNELFLFQKGNVEQLNPDCTADEQAELLPYDQAWEVPRDSIKLGHQLGAGAFGRVVKAEVTNLEDDKPKTTVALKMIKSSADPSHLRALILELKILIHLGKHLNIVNLMGAYTLNVAKGELWVMVEYCRHGNLLSFMKKHRNKFINQLVEETGEIDPSRLVADPSLPLSPLSVGSSSHSRSGYSCVDEKERLLSMSSSMKLRDPPKKLSNHEPNLGPQVSYAGNPQYSEVGAMMYGEPEVPEVPGGLRKQVSTDSSYVNVNSSPHPRLSTKTSQESRTSNAPAPRLVFHQLSTESRYGSDSGVNVVAYKRILNSNGNPPMSPIGSLYEGGTDSRGSPFTFEDTNIPALTSPFTSTDLVCWAWQVSQGMDYLAKRKILHGDLAARNLLLAENNVIKISDFGLSRELYSKDVYMKKGDDLMPIKWMAIEAIQDRIFSTQSDMWAYGIVLWEMFTLGQTPYPGMEVNPEFVDKLVQGYRMKKPRYCPNSVYDLMLQCWSDDPCKRPFFNEVCHKLDNYLSQEAIENYHCMNDAYLEMNEGWFKERTDYLNMCTSPTFSNVHNTEEDSNNTFDHVMTEKSYVNTSTLGTEGDNYLNMTLNRKQIFSPRPPVNYEDNVFNFDPSMKSCAVVDEEKNLIDSSNTNHYMNAV